MKNLFTRFKVIYLSLIILFSTTVIAGSGKGDEAETILKLSTKIEQAINQRQYGEARNNIAEIIPLMKRDLKVSKKEMATMVDEDDKADFESELKRKNEIYQATKKIYDTSAAAIRVKGKEIVEMLNAYADLVE